MHEQSISRNYADALLALARKADATADWATLIHSVAKAVEEDQMLRRFLAAPQISAAEKNAVLATAFTGKAPPLFIKFLQKLVTNRRQVLIPDIATEYGNLLDAAEGRVHARVTVAREPSAADEAAIVKELSRALKKAVVAHMVVNPAILGGIVVRVGDTVMDGSVRRRLRALRSSLTSGR